MSEAQDSQLHAEFATHWAARQDYLVRVSSLTLSDETLDVMQAEAWEAWQLAWLLGHAQGRVAGHVSKYFIGPVAKSPHLDKAGALKGFTGDDDA